jgi:hypothetical protein
MSLSRNVIAAVRFACTHSLLVSGRGSGHNVPGNAVHEGGLMIDFGGMLASAPIHPLLGRRQVRCDLG